MCYRTINTSLPRNQYSIAFQYAAFNDMKGGILKGNMCYIA